MDADLVEIGLQYWSLAGVDQRGEPMWKTSVKTIDTRGRGPANVVAVAAVRAILPDVQCDGCGDALRLRNRSSLAEVLSGRATHCVSCDPKLVRRAAALVAPETEEIRQRRVARQQQNEQEQLQRQACRRAHEVWLSHQRHVVRTDFPGDQQREEIPSADVRAELATLTLLRFAAQVDPIPSMRQWHHPFPFHAGTGVGSLISDARNAGLLLTDAATPPNAFVWDPPSFDAAWAESNCDPDKLPLPKRTASYFPYDTLLRIPFGSSPDTGRALLDKHLGEQLDPANMTAQRQDDLLSFAHELLVAEAVRWFARQLAIHNMPEVAENHAPRLTESVKHLVAEYSLGYAYFLGWKAAKTAAAAARKNPSAPLRNMTTHGVNMFEREVRQSLDHQPATLREFDESSSLPLAATTKTAFFAVLQMDPMRTSLASARAALPTPISTTASSSLDSPGPRPGAAGFRRGTSNWVEFAGDSMADLLLRAAEYLVPLEQQMPITAPSMHWEMLPSEYDAMYSLRIELDGVNTEQLPEELRTNLALNDNATADPSEVDAAGSTNDDDLNTGEPGEG
ncbi:hypothetical protein F9C11_20705 [Amycolatopsis sp. VS8301801F10]|uniref:hypothetical protein n=1 Tax=Amycolatopsis sp. VS8301801F10 TaxID=2652442 RepID=UPI0038FC6495